MGLFTSAPSPPSHATPPPSADGAYIAPDRTKRAQCWHARDAFFDCLERNGIVDSLKEKDRSEEKCGGESRGLERECAASWVRKHQISFAATLFGERGVFRGAEGSGRVGIGAPKEVGGGKLEVRKKGRRGYKSRKRKRLVVMMANV